MKCGLIIYQMESKYVQLSNAWCLKCYSIFYLYISAIIIIFLADAWAYSEIYMHAEFYWSTKFEFVFIWIRFIDNFIFLITVSVDTISFYEFFWWADLILFIPPAKRYRLCLKKLRTIYASSAHVVNWRLKATIKVAAALFPYLATPAAAMGTHYAKHLFFTCTVGAHTFADSRNICVAINGNCSLRASYHHTAADKRVCRSTCRIFQHKLQFSKQPFRMRNNAGVY